MSRVLREVAFGLENIGTRQRRSSGAHARRSPSSAPSISPTVPSPSSPGGELQRVCLASAVALRPKLLLLDEPTSQLDPAAAEAFLEHVVGLGIAVLISDHRPRRVLDHADRVVFLDEGRLLLDATVSAAQGVAGRAPADLARSVLERSWRSARRAGVPVGRRAVRLPRRRSGRRRLDLELRRGEIVALAGPNGTGKTTIAKLAAGLLAPDAGTAELRGRAGDAPAGPDPVLHPRAGRRGGRSRRERRSRPCAHRALAALGLARQWRAGIHVISRAASANDSRSRRCS